jgi:streptogramin lyase
VIASDRAKFLLAALGVVILGVSVRGFVQAGAAPNSQPNPYYPVQNWLKLPEGRTLGSTSAVDIGPDGSIWVAERCGANTCAGSNLEPVLRFNSSGKLVKSFGSGLFVFPHGIFVDRDGNVWITDAQGRDGKGHQVIKFNPEGKVLLALGKAGVAGDGTDTFNQPSDVVVAPNGNIFVADGHGGNSNARIVKFSSDGRFIKAWGKKGSAPGEFDTPHAIAMDSKGRIFVGDRANNRIQIFDQDGNFIAEWKQFGRPSGIFIDKHDLIYVADSESRNDNHPGWKRGIRVGSVKDGSVTGFIPDPEPDFDHKPTSGAEGVAADSRGNIYGAEVGPKDLIKYVRK